MHSSIRLSTPCEPIHITHISPFVDKVQIKVCYVGETPNRNGSVITKQTAEKIAESLPGSPIVGYYNKEEGDFEEHNRIMEISDGEISFVPETRPYGFVDTNAPVWFADFLDDNKEVRTYLCTEGYLWTKQYPEAKRAVTLGNNQSMELDGDSVQGYWKDDPSVPFKVFVINEAIIANLCILGENHEPCFEGAGIGTNLFSLGQQFKVLMNEIKKNMNEGGEVMEDNEVIETTSEEIEEIEEIETTSEEIETTSEIEELNNQIAELNNTIEEYSSQINSLTAQLAELTEFKAKVDRTEKENLWKSYSMLTDEEKTSITGGIDSNTYEELDSKLAVYCVHNHLFQSEETEDEPATAFSLNSNYENTSIPGWIKGVENRRKNFN